jgi:undecaprenyl diphosphate synthase
MDGNGRWAKKRGLPRTAGHTVGVKVLKKLVYYAKDMGLKNITVYAFSTENWKRPLTEINVIMSLLDQLIDETISEIVDLKVRVRFVGEKSGISKALLEKMHMTLDEFLEENNHCTGKTENGKWDWDYMNPYKILRQIYPGREATHKKIKSKDMEHILLRRYVEYGEGAGEKSDLLLGKKITLCASYEKKSFENAIKLIGLIKSAGGEYTLKVSEADTFVKCDDKICMREAFLKAHSEFKPKFISLDKLLDTLGITYEDIESMEMPDINYLMDDKYSNKVAV